MVKVWTLPADEDWICDQLVKDWVDHNADMVTLDPHKADIIWLLSDWRWASVPYQFLSTKKVVTTVHHIVPEKFDARERWSFDARDKITTAYHVYNQRTFDFIRPLTTKPIHFVKYWANQHLWKRSGLSKLEQRAKYGLPQDAYVVGSFQRDTEGFDLRSPKLEKGPDLWADAVIKMHQTRGNVHALLAGWRRQYVITRLEAGGVPYSYFERPSQEIVRDMYESLDEYVVTARHEGGPQSLIECGLLNVPVVSTPVGIAEQVLPATAISIDVTMAHAVVPNVKGMHIPEGFTGYRSMFNGL